MSSGNKDKKTAIIFAAYSWEGNLFVDIPPYLAELKKHSDFLIYVTDNESVSTCCEEIVSRYADKLIVKKHGKYDFGSYQLGFEYLLNNKQLYNHLGRIFFCNDSVIYQGRSLDKFFEKAQDHHFYGLTWHANGFSRCETSQGVIYPWNRFPHIQSYLFSVSKEIADNSKFQEFMTNIEIEADKNDVIAKYEIGLSRMVAESLGYELESYYPKTEDFDPCGYFLSDLSTYKHPRLFIKRRTSSIVELEEDIDFEG